METTLLFPELSTFGPDRSILQAYNHSLRIVRLAYLCDGGPNEDWAFLIEFTGVALIHMPAILHEPMFPVLLNHADASLLIPPVSFDPEEFRHETGGYKVFGFLRQSGSPTGFYVAADSCSWSVVPLESCDLAW